jgi:hypothetical protein
VKRSNPSEEEGIRKVSVSKVSFKNKLILYQCRCLKMVILYKAGNFYPIIQIIPRNVVDEDL